LIKDKNKLATQENKTALSANEPCSEEVLKMELPLALSRKGQNKKKLVMNEIKLT
jgi:hypothetical protein